ncbi:MAG: pyrroloquinoline quinone precursor peptide PqqA [Rhodovarius sp.]|nr:pyrroloquinoline quinone precursor peptide PqqA [Rhodovarius sp.]MDW8314553.1 pyrroloquinoline quinone precursor peptide PqqA [Rhodovarius sp.]
MLGHEAAGGRTHPPIRLARPCPLDARAKCRHPLSGPAGMEPAPVGGNTMAWKTPKIVEVSLALEINSYACAEIG